MKNLFLVLFAAVLIALLASPGWAGNKELVFEWEQVLPESNDLKEWRVYVSPASGGPWTLLKVISYVAPASTYTDNVAMTSPDGQRTQYFFTLTALDTSSNESPPSDEVNTWIDFETPGKPTKFTVTVKVVPAAP